MRRKSSNYGWITALALTTLLVLAVVASAQQPATTPQPGMASPAAAPADPTAPAAVPQAQQPAPADTTATPAAAQTAADADKIAAAPGSPDTAKSEEKKSHLFKEKKKKPPKVVMVPVTIERGVLTVDGWTGKADLNYNIMDLKYIYLWAPGVGTVIVSSEPFPKAQLQGGAFNGHTLTVTAGGHTLQLASDRDLLSGKDLIKPAYVAVDTAYVPANPNYPQFGYGTTPNAPYAWPASMANYTGDVARSPPLPPSLLPPIKSNCAATMTPAKVDPAVKTEVAKTDVAKTEPAKADPTKNPCGAPMVMYPVKESKTEKAAVKKDEKKGEKVDETFK